MEIQRTFTSITNGYYKNRGLLKTVCDTFSKPFY